TSNRTDVAVVGYIGIALCDKVVAALRIRGNPLAELCWTEFTAKLLGKEKKRFLLLGIEKVRNKERSTNRQAKVISSVKRGFFCLVKVVPSIEGFVAQEFISVSMELATARLDVCQNGA